MAGVGYAAEQREVGRALDRGERRAQLVGQLGGQPLLGPDRRRRPGRAGGRASRRARRARWSAGPRSKRWVEVVLAPVGGPLAIWVTGCEGLRVTRRAMSPAARRPAAPEHAGGAAGRRAPSARRARSSWLTTTTPRSPLGVVNGVASSRPRRPDRHRASPGRSRPAASAGVADVGRDRAGHQPCRPRRTPRSRAPACPRGRSSSSAEAARWTALTTASARSCSTCRCRCWAVRREEQLDARAPTSTIATVISADRREHDRATERARRRTAEPARSRVTGCHHLSVKPTPRTVVERAAASRPPRA